MFIRQMGGRGKSKARIIPRRRKELMQAGRERGLKELRELGEQSRLKSRL